MKRTIFFAKAAQIISLLFLGYCVLAFVPDAVAMLFQSLVEHNPDIRSSRLVMSLCMPQIILPYPDALSFWSGLGIVVFWAAFYRKYTPGFLRTVLVVLYVLVAVSLTIYPATSWFLYGGATMIALFLVDGMHQTHMDYGDAETSSDAK